MKTNLRIGLEAKQLAPRKRVRTPDGPNGMVLILVLIVIAMLSLSAYTFAELMLTENKSTRIAGRQVQADAMVESAAELLRLYLAQTPEMLEQSGGVYDNPIYFQGALVVDDILPRNRGRFCAVAPRIENGDITGVRYGLENESARLNLNTLLLADEQSENGARTLLMGLPGMTEDVADAILDWIDEDSEPRELGAELEYYASLSTPYAPKNGPLHTIEELLLVRGVSPDLLFGNDMNRNGLIDPPEQAGPLLSEMYGTDPESNRGWSAYLTLHSKEANVRADGTPRIDLNSADLQQLYDQLSDVFDPEWASYIVAYRLHGGRQAGGTQSNGGDGAGRRGRGGRGNDDDEEESGEEVSATSLDLDLTQQGRGRFTQVLDLVGSQVQFQLNETDGEGESRRRTQRVRNPFPDDPAAAAEYLPVLLSQVTTNPAPSIPGRINIDLAPRTVLLGIPGMQPETVEQVIAQRTVAATPAQEEQRHETWLYTSGIVTLEEMKRLMPFVTAGGSVYRAQIVGYFDQDGPASRAEVIFDASQATTGPARIVFWRNLSHLGRGYPLEVLGVGLE